MDLRYTWEYYQKKKLAGTSLLVVIKWVYDSIDALGKGMVVFFIWVFVSVKKNHHVNDWLLIEDITALALTHYKSWAFLPPKGKEYTRVIIGILSDWLYIEDMVSAVDFIDVSHDQEIWDK